jgi:hypothetical protein
MCEPDRTAMRSRMCTQPLREHQAREHLVIRLDSSIRINVVFGGEIESSLRMRGCHAG